MAAKHHLRHLNSPCSEAVCMNTHRAHTHGIDAISADRKPLVSSPQTWDEGIWTKK